MTTDSIYPKPVEQMTDLELLDLYVDKCSSFIDPRIFRHVTARGLYSVVNRLRGDRHEMKAQVRAMLAERGDYIGDLDIERIAAVVARIKATQKEIAKADPTAASEIIQLAERLAELAGEVRDFYN